MRTAFIDQLLKEAQVDDKIFLLVGDLGYNVVEPFARTFPERFRNVGIAEQNMAGIAAGLSMCGYNVYIYSIGNFPTLRCIEQIRNDAAYHNANVKVVAVGGGYAYGDLGATHHATEALGIMRAIPDIVVTSPSDPTEARAITHLSSTYNGTMYIQLGKAGERTIHPKDINPEIGDIVPVRLNKSSKAILTTGSISSSILEDEKSSDYDIYTIPFIKPINVEQLVKIVSMYDSITTVEEHQKSTGMGAAVIEMCSDLYAKGQIARYPRIHRVAINDTFSHISGNQQYLREINGLKL